MRRHILSKLLVLRPNTHVRSPPCVWHNLGLPTLHLFARYTTAPPSESDGGAPPHSKDMPKGTDTPPPKYIAKALTVYEKLIHNNELCIGCGVVFQSERPEQAGYIALKHLEDWFKKLEHQASSLAYDPHHPSPPKKKINAANETWAEEKQPRRKEDPLLQGKSSSPFQIICQRCKELHGKNKTSILAPSLLPKDLKLLHYGGHHLFIQLVDILDFPLGYFRIAHMLPKNAMYYLVFNKIDLLPLSATQARVKEWARSITVETMQNQKTRPPQEIFIISSKSGLGIPALFETIHKYRQRFKLSDVIILGTTNAGKSEFMNCLHRMVQYPKLATPHVTSTRVHGTTLAPIAMPLSRFAGLMKLTSREVESTAKLIDTPGVFATDFLTTYLPMEMLDVWHPGRRLVPRTYKLYAGTTLYLGSLARVDVMQGCGTCTVWASSLAPLHITSRTKALRFQDSGTFPAILKPHTTIPSMQHVRDMVVPRCEKESAEHTLELVFGGAGFLGVASSRHLNDPEMRLDIYTAGARGFAVRAPLLPHDTSEKIKRIHFAYNRTAMKLGETPVVSSGLEHLQPSRDPKEEGPIDGKDTQETLGSPHQGVCV